jgi:hypothetical protein
MINSGMIRCVVYFRLANTGDLLENGWIYKETAGEQVGVVTIAVASKRLEERSTELQKDLRNVDSIFTMGQRKSKTSK